MIELLIITAIKLDCPSYGVLDAYFSTGPAFKGAQACKRLDDAPWVHLIVAAKRHYVAYPSDQATRTEKINTGRYWVSDPSLLPFIIPSMTVRSGTRIASCFGNPPVPGSASSGLSTKVGVGC